MNPSTQGKLHGKIALVTGASRLRGIGAAICRALAREGADILFTYWQAYDRRYWGAREDATTALERELQGLGVRAQGFPADLSQPEEPKRILDEAERRMGTPVILVNNAAHSVRTDYRTLNADILDAHYAVNLRGALLLSTEWARRCPEGTGGRILFVTSGQSRGPMPGELPYVATKGAIDALTVTLSAEVAPKGITVNAVNPGPTDSGWMSDEWKRELLKKFPMGRVGLPEDAARLIAFLASDEAQWITGQVIHSEGGFLRV